MSISFSYLYFDIGNVFLSYIYVFLRVFSSWYWRFPLLYFGIIDVFLCCILVLLRAQSEFLLWLGMSNLPSMRWEEGKLAEMLADWQKQNSSQLKQLRTLTVDRSWNAKEYIVILNFSFFLPTTYMIDEMLIVQL